MHYDARKRKDTPENEQIIFEIPDNFYVVGIISKHEFRKIIFYRVGRPNGKQNRARGKDDIRQNGKHGAQMRFLRQFRKFHGTVKTDYGSFIGL